MTALPPALGGLCSLEQVRLPVPDRRCRTCLHAWRALIQDLLDGGTPPPVIVRMLAARLISPPGVDSIRNHQRRHRATPAVMRRVQRGLELLDEDRMLLEQHAPQMAAGTSAVEPRMPG